MSINIDDWLTKEEQSQTFMDSVIETVPLMRNTITDVLENETLGEENKKLLLEILGIIDSMDISDSQDYLDKWYSLVYLATKIDVRYY